MNLNKVTKAVGFMGTAGIIEKYIKMRLAAPTAYNIMRFNEFVKIKDYFALSTVPSFYILFC
jgi:hypothetical protein